MTAPIPAQPAPSSRLDTELLSHRAAIRRLARRLLSSDHVNDIEQEVWVRALGSSTRPDGSAGLRPWLLAVTRNVCIDALRARGRMCWCPLQDDPPAPTNTSPPSAAVADLLATLPEALRSVMVAHHLDGMSYAAISDATGLSHAAIAQRLWRARKQLRRAC